MSGQEGTTAPLEVGIDEGKPELQRIRLAPAKKRGLAAEPHRVGRPPSAASKAPSLDADSARAAGKPELQGAVPGRCRQGGVLQTRGAVRASLHESLSYVLERQEMRLELVANAKTDE